MCQPKLGRRQIHPTSNRCQSGMIAGVSDPRLIADQLVCQIHLANLGERQRGADIRAGFDVPQRRLIDRPGFEAEALKRHQAVKGFGIDRGSLEAAFDPFGMSGRHIGSRGPEMSCRNHFNIAGTSCCRSKCIARCLPILLAPGGKPGNPIGLRRPIAISGAGLVGEATCSRIVTRQIIRPGNPILPFGQRIGIKIETGNIENRFGLIRAIGFQERHDTARHCRTARFGAGDFATTRSRTEPTEFLGVGQIQNSGRTARLGQTRQRLRLRQFWRPFSERGERLSGNLWAPFGEIEFGTRYGMKRAFGHGIKFGGCIGPLPIVNGRKYLGIFFARVGAELGGIVRARTLRTTLNLGRCECGGSDRQSEECCSKKNRLCCHSWFPLISICMSAQASALRRGLWSRKRGEKLTTTPTLPDSWLNLCKIPRAWASSIPRMARLTALPISQSCLGATRPMWWRAISPNLEWLDGGSRPVGTRPGQRATR